MEIENNGGGGFDGGGDFDGAAGFVGSGLTKDDFRGLIGKNRNQVIQIVGKPDYTTELDRWTENWGYENVYDPVSERGDGTAILEFRGGICINISFL
jgi:hypothetical protein